jgi:hypothetical protein
MSIIEIVDNTVPQEMFELSYEKVFSKGIWDFSNNSEHGDINTSFGANSYSLEINKLLEEGKLNESNVIFNLWNSINDKIKVEDKYKNNLKRIHFNCGPPLYDQFIHQDNKVTFSKNITIVYFAHPIWDISWGGELLVYDMLKTTVTAGVFPVPNRAVVFPSYLPHRGVAVSRICPAMRISIAFQCTFNNTL